MGAEAGWLAPILPAGRFSSGWIYEAMVATCPGGQGETVMGAERGRLLALEMGLMRCRWVGSGAVEEEELQTSSPEGAWSVLLRSEGADHMWASWSNIPSTALGDTSFNFLFLSSVITTATQINGSRG